MAIYILVALVAYLIGSISFSVIFTKKLAGFDVREKGSKNAGSTNVLRTAGKKIAVLTLICDILKGVIAVLFAKIIGEIDDYGLIAYALSLSLVFLCAIDFFSLATIMFFLGIGGGTGNIAYGWGLLMLFVEMSIFRLLLSIIVCMMLLDGKFLNISIVHLLQMRIITNFPSVLVTALLRT